WDLYRTGGNLSAFRLQLYAFSLVDNPDGTAEKIQGFNEWGLPWKPGTSGEQLTRVSRAEGARTLLEQAFARRLRRGDVEIVLARGGGYALQPRSLIAAAWLELGDRVRRARPEKTCPQCGAAFVPLTVRRVFCSEKCKDDAKNARRSAPKKRRAR